MATLVSPGNIVVPLSAIIDQLRGKLSSVEIEALLAAIVSKKKTEVRPGDLITADLINQVLLDLQDLNTQVAALSGGVGAPPKNVQAVATLYDTWNFYTNLAKKGSFLPSASSVEALRSAISITAYLQDVASAALSAGVLGYVTSADNLLDVFGRLYERQHDLVVLFAAAIPGIPDTSEHRRFSTLLNIQLEQDDSVGGLSLKNALDSRNLDAAVAAQARINGMVLNQGGDVTTGNLEVTFAGSQGTEALVISGGPAVILFNVTNKTNRILTAIQLKPEFIGQRTSWTQFATVVDPTTGSALSSISLSPFDSSKPSDPSGRRVVGVAVKTPAGAADGDSGTLQMTASVPPPVGVIDSDVRDLFVKTTATPQAPATIAFTQDSPVASGDLANAAEGAALTLDFTFNFNVLQGPQTRDFRSRVEISSSAADAGLFRIQFGPTALAIDPAASSDPLKKISLPFQMTHGTGRTWRVVVTPQAGSKGKQLSFKAVVESIADGIKGETKALTISVK